MQCRLPVLTGCLCLALSGCLSYSPYGPGYMGGGYTYGPTYAAPPQGAPTYITPQPAAPYSPRLMQPAPPPGTSFSAPRALPPSTLQPAPRPSGMPLNSATIPAAPPESRVVPQPFEGPAAGGSPAIATPPSGGRPPSTLGAPADPDDDEDNFKKPLGAASPATERTTSLPNDNEENLRKLGPESFSEQKTNLPIGKKDANAKGASFESPDVAGATRPNPYAYDKKSYAWLRGVLDYDAVDKHWHITYSNDHHDGDTYGGSLTLVDSPQMEDKFLTNDVVLVDGSIDVSQRDRFGRPMYRLRKIERLRAKTETIEQKSASRLPPE